VSTEAKEDESSTGHIWAAGFHHVVPHCCLVGVLKLTNHLFNLPFVSDRGELRMTETTDTESADTGARL
jgi:hypothetical protein